MLLASLQLLDTISEVAKDEQKSWEHKNERSLEAGPLSVALKDPQSPDAKWEGSQRTQTCLATRRV